MIPEANDTTENLAEIVSPISRRWKHILATGIDQKDALINNQEGFKKVPYGILFSGSRMAPPQSPCKAMCVCVGGAGGGA